MRTFLIGLLIVAMCSQLHAECRCGSQQMDSGGHGCCDECTLYGRPYREFDYRRYFGYPWLGMRGSAFLPIQAESGSVEQSVVVDSHQPWLQPANTEPAEHDPRIIRLQQAEIPLRLPNPEHAAASHDETHRAQPESAVMPAVHQAAAAVRVIPRDIISKREPLPPTSELRFSPGRATAEDLSAKR